MTDPRARDRALATIDGAIALTVVLLLVQMWLLSATLESYLEGHLGALLPGAVVSGLLFAAAVALHAIHRRRDNR